MEPIVAARALARASATLIRGHDVAGTLATVLEGCRAALEVDAAGILVETNGRLELLSASSHAATELEIHQAQLDEGPCVDAHASAGAVAVSGRANLLAKWPAFGDEMVRAGFSSVHASPLRWQRLTIGAMGLFRRSAEPFTAEDDTYAQAFADIATSVIVTIDEPSPEQLHARLDKALTGRHTIEQAKGVLAEQRGVSMAEAYDLLVRSADDHGQPLSEWSAQVIREAGQPADEPATRADPLL